MRFFHPRAFRFALFIGIWNFLFGFSQVGISYGQDTTAVPSNAKAEALYYDAVRERLKGDEDAARETLLKVVAQAPTQAAPHYDLARIYARAQQPDKAIDEIKKAITLAPQNVWYKRQHGELLIARNRFAEAADIYAGLVKRDEGRIDDEAASRAALLYQRAAKYKEALAQLDIALGRVPDDEDLLMQKQQVYLKMNDLEGALRTVRRLIDGNPREARYYALLADLYENNKQPGKAAEVYEDAEKRFPGDPIIQLGLAQHFRDAKDTARYNTYVKRAITNRELDPESQIRLLVPYLQELARDTARHAEGVGIAGDLAAQHPGNPAVQSFYGSILQEFGRSGEAVAQFKKVVAIDPGKFDAWRQLLSAQLSPADADSLVVWSAKAAKLFPTQALVHFFSGVGQNYKKNYTAAIRDISRAIDLQPEENEELLADMYTSLGDAYNSAGQFGKSDSAYEQGLRLNPKNATVLNNYAYYLSVRGVRLADAEKMSKQSLVIRPGEGTFLDTYGWILYKQGKWSEALDYIQQAVDAAGESADGTLYDHLGDAQYRAKETDKAVDSWKRAKELKADNPLLEKKISERKLYE